MNSITGSPDFIVLGKNAAEIWRERIKYHIQIPHGSVVRFKKNKKPIYCHQDLYYVYETQVGKIVRLKHNPELCGTDFNANVDDLEIVDLIRMRSSNE